MSAQRKILFLSLPGFEAGLQAQPGGAVPRGTHLVSD